MTTTSVVIPSYNHARFLDETLSSVAAQTVPPDEVVVVDDGSTDGSLELLRRREARGVRVLTQANAGAHAALGRGVEASTGDLVFLLTSDDRFPPGRIEAMTRTFAADPSLDFAVSWIQVIDAKGRRLDVKKAWRNLPPWPCERPERSFSATEEPAWNLLQGNYATTTSNFVFTRRLWRELGGFLPLRFAHDWDFALRAARRAPPRVIEEALVDYRVHDDNTIRKDRREMEFEVLWVLARHIPRFAADAARALPERRREFFWRLGASIQTFGHESLFRTLLALSAAGGAGTEDAFTRLLDRGDATRELFLSLLPP